MRWIAMWAAGVVLVLPAFLHAQEETPAKSQHDALMRAVQNELQQFQGAFQAAKSEAEEEQLLEQASKRLEPFAARFVAVAERHPTDPIALDSLLMALNVGRQTPASRKAVDLIVQGHLAGDRVDEILETAKEADSSAAEELIRTAITRHPKRELRVYAALVLAQRLRSVSEDENNPKAKAQADEAEQYLNEIVTRHAEARYQGSSIAELATEELYHLRFLSIGKAAPDIEGEDVEGQKFKLSDYRGKVVVLDFWGHW